MSFFLAPLYLLTSLFILAYGWSNSQNWGIFAYIYTFIIIILTIIFLVYCGVKPIISAFMKTITLSREFPEEKWKEQSK